MARVARLVDGGASRVYLRAMEFVVQLAMDKCEMSHPRNVARALERLASELDARFALESRPDGAEGVIRDVSGSVVGRWELRR